ncbi:glycosyltransferase family 4 protein [Pseudomonas entomophila]|uniref:MraY family glycosyltransferase n=1 Tax=Pseudomonas entomophila TaxID=312306 RepID=UPI0015E42C11|nr:glycosyltransferase family 4 protein [Pseudomonas entomophila]MBA1194398.1 glycosyltransferase family 4 protein [Pseudomonas entomophila]
MTFAWLLIAVAILSCILTWVLRRYALARSLMDIPNARSSHTVPTPRGGGVAIVLTFLPALGVLWQLGWMSEAHALALGAAGLLVAIVGFIDDHRHIPARWRLLGHFAAALGLLVGTGGAPVLHVAGIPVHSAGILLPLLAVYLVWLLNLYNFMDGIDGIAGAEALAVCGGISLVYALGGHTEALVAPLVLAAAVLGFLVWNAPPAKIFMGDAGSGFLGLTLGGLSLQGAWLDAHYFWAWLILLGVFVVDATVTLLRRLLAGEKVYQAHRSHAYQHAARRAGRHLPVTLATAAITLGWLLPMALCVTWLGLDGMLGTVIAYLPLGVVALRYQAGKHELT